MQTLSRASMQYIPLRIVARGKTAQPVADALDLPINIYDPADNEAVLEKILKNHKGKIILIVGHSDTVPTLMADLGASKKVPPIAEMEYDNIYIVFDSMVRQDQNDSAALRRAVYRRAG